MLAITGAVVLNGRRIYAKAGADCGKYRICFEQVFLLDLEGKIDEGRLTVEHKILLHL